MMQEVDTNQAQKVDKSKYIKGIFINVYEHSVSEHLFKKKPQGGIDLKEVYHVIDCDLVERAPLSNYGFFDEDHDLLMDEEGLFKQTPGFFLSKVFVMGNAVIFGVNWEQGDWQNADIQVSSVIEKIVWLDTQTAHGLARQGI
jgi:hypothetical protein